MIADQNFDAPVIHVVSESPRLEMLQTRLRQAGIRPVPVRGSYLPPDSAPALIDLVTRDFEVSANDQRLVATIGKRGDMPSFSEIHLTDITQIASLPARLAIRQREKQRLREIQLRAQTSEKFGPSAVTPTSPQATRMLWLGHDAPFLNAIKASLAENDVSLVAAISRLTAEDYLSSGRFHTLVLCPSGPEDEAAKLLSRIKTLELVHIPHVILLLRPELSAALRQEHVAQADQILDLSTHIEDVAERLLSVCAEPTLASEETFGMTSLAQDPSTGLVSRDYLESHLEAQMAQADKLALPLSLIAVNVSGEDDVKAAARLIKSLLRDTDLAARLDPHHICVTLPNTQYRGGVILARRIEEAMQRPVSWRVIERRQFHTLKSLLGGLTARTSLASRRTA